MPSLYNIDRQTASSVLGVSVRTVDRYISSGRIKKVKNQGRTWLSNSDVQDILKEMSETGQVIVDNLSLSQDYKASQQTKNVFVDQNYISPNSDVSSAHKDNSYVELQKIYEDTKKDLEETNKKLQQAIYKIGHLESQLKNMIPQIEVQKREKLLLQNNLNLQDQLNIEVQKKEMAVKNLLSDIKFKEQELETERFNKAIFAILLFFTILTLVGVLIYTL